MPIQPATKPNPASLGHNTVPKPPQSTIDELKAKLLRYDRTPFLEMLAVFLAQMPSWEAISKLRETDPLKYIKAVEALQRMGGYIETSEHIVRHNFEDMSDMQLQEYLRSARARAPLELQAIDVEAKAIGHSDAAPLPQHAAEDTRQHETVLELRHEPTAVVPLPRYSAED